MTTPWSDWHNQPVIKITPGGVELTAVALRDLKLINPTVPTAPISGNYGVQCDVPSDGSKVSALTLERVNIVNMGDDGIHLHALGGSDSFFVFVTLRDVYCTTNWGRGLFASYASLLNCYGCYFNGNQLDGARRTFARWRSTPARSRTTARRRTCLSSTAPSTARCICAAVR